VDKCLLGGFRAEKIRTMKSLPGLKASSSACFLVMFFHWAGSDPADAWIELVVT